MKNFADANGKIVRSVSFRTGPSTSDDRIRYLKTGESVFILSEHNAYWYKVKTERGDTGYISSNSKYIDTDYEHPTPSFPAPDQNLKDENGTIVRSVSFRSGPSTSYDRIRYLKKGEGVIVLEETNKYWYKVKTERGDVGYVSTNSKYIDTDFEQLAPTFPDASTAAQKVITAGMKYLGTPYEYGSSRNDTRTFDCSDFVRQAFLDGLGITLPADSRQQADYVKEIGETSTDWEDLKPGDLLFFMDYKGSKKSNYDGINKSKQRITHDAIYLGDGKILHTYSEESGGVKIDTLEGKHWEYRFIFGGSAFK